MVPRHGESLHGPFHVHPRGCLVHEWRWNQGGGPKGQCGPVLHNEGAALTVWGLGWRGTPWPAEQAAVGGLGVGG